MLLAGENAASLPAGLYQQLFINRLDGVDIDDTGIDPLSGQQLTSLDGLAYQDTSSHNGHILAVPQGNALAHLKLVGRGIIKNGGSQTAKAQINRAYIGSGSLYSSLGFHIIGGIDNHHTGNGAH